MSGRIPLTWLMVLGVMVFGMAPRARAEVYTVYFQGIVDKITVGDVLDGSVATTRRLSGNARMDFEPARSRCPYAESTTDRSR